jgi:phage/plasmid-associated DNA primase
VGARNAYAAYCQWAQQGGVEAVTETKFGRSLTARVTAMGGSKAKRRDGTVYLGIRITDAVRAQPTRMAA